MHLIHHLILIQTLNCLTRIYIHMFILIKLYLMDIIEYIYSFVSQCRTMKKIQKSLMKMLMVWKHRKRQHSLDGLTISMYLIQVRLFFAISSVEILIKLKLVLNFCLMMIFHSAV